MIKAMSLLIFAFSLQAHAFVMTSQVQLSQSGELNKILNVQCGANENLCANICHNISLCQIPETICEDCATESSPVLHTVYTDLNGIFKSEFMAVDQTQIAEFFRTRQFMTLTYDSFLNLFTPEKKSDLKSQFETLCYIQQPKSALLLTTVNEQKQIDQLVGVICQDQTGRSVILPMEYNPQFSNKKMNFWKPSQDGGLQLKMTGHL